MLTLSWARLIFYLYYNSIAVPAHSVLLAPSVQNHMIGSPRLTSVLSKNKSAGATTDDQTNAAEHRAKGEFVRGVSTTRNWIVKDGPYPPAKAYNCQWVSYFNSICSDKNQEWTSRVSYATLSCFLSISATGFSVG